MHGREDCVYVRTGAVAGTVIPPCCGEDDEYYSCTRPKGHEGEHVACGILGHRYRVWE